MSSSSPSCLGWKWPGKPPLPQAAEEELWDETATETWQAWAAEHFEGPAHEETWALAASDDPGAEEARGELWRRWCWGAEETLLDAARQVSRRRDEPILIQAYRGRGQVRREPKANQERSDQRGQRLCRGEHRLRCMLAAAHRLRTRAQCAGDRRRAAAAAQVVRDGVSDFGL
eukprot:10749822-Alexandrium_andersonii.AAC.1